MNTFFGNITIRMMFNTKIVRLFLLNLLSLSLSLSYTSFLLICVHLKRIGVSSDSIFFARDKPGRRFDKIFRQVTLAFHKWVLLRRTHARKCMIDVCVMANFGALSFALCLASVPPVSISLSACVYVLTASSSKYPTNLWHVLGENK